MKPTEFLREFDEIEPDNEPTEEMIENLVQDYVSDVRRDTLRWLKDHGYEVKNFVDMDGVIDEMVNKGGWYRYENCRGYVEIEYIGNKLEDEEELRKGERSFLGSSENDFSIEIREDFIDIEEVCFEIGRAHV